MINHEEVLIEQNKLKLLLYQPDFMRIKSPLKEELTDKERLELAETEFVLKCLMSKHINVIVHRYSAKKLEQVLGELSMKLNIPYKYDKYRRLISIEEGLFHPVYIDGRTGPCERLAGLRPDFYNVDDEEIKWFLEQGASKVNGIELDNVCSVLKIIDILKIPEGKE